MEEFNVFFVQILAQETVEQIQKMKRALMAQVEIAVRGSHSVAGEGCIQDPSIGSIVCYL